jgi:mannosyltransferase OCH1-like enzyme
MYTQFYTEVWSQYPLAIHRADALRYYLLFHFGGLYADLDFVPRVEKERGRERRERERGRERERERGGGGNREREG